MILVFWLSAHSIGGAINSIVSSINWTNATRQAKDSCKPLKPQRAGILLTDYPLQVHPSWALSVSQSSDSASVTPDLQTKIHGPNNTESISSAHDNVSTPPCPVTQSSVTSISSIGNSAGVFRSVVACPLLIPLLTPLHMKNLIMSSMNSFLRLLVFVHDCCCTSVLHNHNLLIYHLII